MDGTSHKVQHRDEAQLAADLLKARVKAHLLGESPPTIALGRFELLRLLGRGAAGAVFEARDRQRDQLVALKVLRDPEAGSVARFKREFRGLADVVHENLAQLYELFAEGTNWYFTMELVRGVPFTTYVREAQDEATLCDPERLRAALAQLLSAVQAVHAAGRLHCDLKPSNVLVTASGRVVVLDFGLLTVTADLTGLHAGSVGLGTPAFMAPELDAGNGPSTASDAYAVGVMLYSALTGALPFAGVGSALVDSRKRRPAPRARDRAPDTPPDLDALCAALLERDPEARATIGAALAALAPQTAGPRPSRRSVFRAPLVGRDMELAALRSAFAQAELGRTAAVLVSGRSGIGKTALIDRFAAELGTEALVLVGRCHERESVPYRAFDGVVDALATAVCGLSEPEREALAPAGTAALLRIFPQLGRCFTAHAGADDLLPPAPDEQRQSAFAAFKELLRRVAARRRLAVVVDDLQWADLDSARLLLEVLGPPAAPALLYVGAYRSEEEERSEFVRELRAHAGGDGSTAVFTWLELGPLSERAAVELAVALVPPHVAHAPAIAARAAREAGGVPFVLTELVAYALEPEHDERATISLGDLLSCKVGALTTAERRALSLLALAARPLDRGLLESALCEPDGAARTLRRLALDGLVQQDANGRLVVYHDRLREHVSERLSQDDGSTLHRELAQAYERAGSADEELSIEHWRAGGEPALALRAALGAAEAAATKLAFNRAAELYRTTLALLPAGDARSGALHERLGDTLVYAGRSAEAAHAFLAAAAQAPDAPASALRCRAAQHWLRSGHKDEAIALLYETFPRIGLRYPRSKPAIYGALVQSRLRLAVRTRWRGLRRVRAAAPSSAGERLYALRSVFREFALYDPVRSVLFQSWFYEHALREDDSESIFVAFAWDIYARAFMAREREQRRLLTDLRKLDGMAAELGTPYALATAAMMRGIVAFYAGRFSEGAEYTGRGLRIFRERCLGASWEEALCAVMHYMLVENVGPLSTLFEDAPRMVRRADERVDQFTDALLGAHLASALLAEDRPADAQAFLRERLARLPPSIDSRHVTLSWRLVDAQLYVRDGRGALETIEGMWSGYLASGYDRSPFLRIWAHKRRAQAALEAYRELGDPRLLEIARRAADELGRSGRLDGRVISDNLRAGLAQRRGDLAAAREVLAAALRGCHALGVSVAYDCYALQLGCITAGALGREQRERAEAALRAHGIASPLSWSRIYSGSFED